MQKMIFSAVALVTFSVSGMANEIEEKKVKIESIEMETVNQVKKTSDGINGINCSAIAADTYYSAIYNGADAKQATKLMTKVFIECVML
ncbi:hypothetical protein [Flavobacterium sp.]|uniref:hypothetical protein n=1 Tax=Flavobacterium sp. TaxID=239 RepID=UPI004047EC17